MGSLVCAIILLTASMCFAQDTIFHLQQPKFVGDTLEIPFTFEIDNEDPQGGFDLFVLEYNSGGDYVDQGANGRAASDQRVFKISGLDPYKAYSFFAEARYLPSIDWCLDASSACWPLSDSVDYFYINPDQHYHYTEAFSYITDSTAVITTNTTFKVVEWQYHLPLSSRSSNGVAVQERLYFTNHPDSSQLSWRKRIVDGSIYYRIKYMNLEKKWVEDNPDQVQLIERSQYRLVYRSRGTGTPLVTVVQKHGRVTEVWNYNID